MTVLLTGLSRGFVREYFKGLQGVNEHYLVSEQRPQKDILRKNQGTRRHNKTHTVNTALRYSI